MTPIAASDGAANFRFVGGDLNRDGRGDIMAIKSSNTGSGRMEVHVLDGATGYTSFQSQNVSPITEGDAQNFAFAAADRNTDGVIDLFGIKTRNAASGQAEVHALDGADHFHSFIVQLPPRSRSAMRRISHGSRGHITTMPSRICLALRLGIPRPGTSKCM